MSKKHFIELARLVSRAEYLSDEARDRLVGELVTFCAGTNPRFSPSRFRDACSQAFESGKAVGSRLGR
jgi:hypothetical protein